MSYCVNQICWSCQIDITSVLSDTLFYFPVFSSLAMTSFQFVAISCATIVRNIEIGRRGGRARDSKRKMKTFFNYLPEIRILKHLLNHYFYRYFPTEPFFLSLLFLHCCCMILCCALFRYCVQLQQIMECSRSVSECTRYDKYRGEFANNLFASSSLSVFFRAVVIAAVHTLLSGMWIDEIAHIVNMVKITKTTRPTTTVKSYCLELYFLTHCWRHTADVLKLLRLHSAMNFFRAFLLSLSLESFALFIFYYYFTQLHLQSTILCILPPDPKLPIKKKNGKQMLWYDRRSLELVGVSMCMHICVRALGNHFQQTRVALESGTVCFA